MGGFDFEVIKTSLPYLFKEGMTFTVTLTEVLAPLARVPRLQVTVFVVELYTPPPVAETKVVPAGSGSDAVTPKASDGPLLCTARV